MTRLFDLKNNGCTVSGKDNDGNWVIPDADILLDEQKEARGSADAAPAPLFDRRAFGDDD